MQDLECGGCDAALDGADMGDPGPNMDDARRGDTPEKSVAGGGALQNRLQMAWPHAPVHMLSESGTYFVTAGTYRKEHFFRGAARLRVLQRGLLRVAQDFGWGLEAWAVFSNHYHFVAHSPAAEPGAASLSRMLGTLHEKTAKWLNRIDDARGRQVWHNFRETLLTFEKSYYARLNYVHQNAVKHGLTAVASQYPWCSAAWFEQAAQPAQVKTVYRFKIDQVNVYDAYEPDREW